MFLSFISTCLLKADDDDDNDNDDDDDGKLTFWNGWTMKSVKSCFQPELFSEIFTFWNLRDDTSRICTSVEPLLNGVVQ